MNDLEREVRELLEERSREARVAWEAPPSVVRRGRRRQLGVVAAAFVVLVAALTTSVASMRLPNESTRRALSHRNDPGAPRTSVLSGLTITYPSNWFLMTFPTSDLGGHIAQLTNFDPASTRPCFSGDAVALPPDGVLMLIDGWVVDTTEGEPVWPVDLRYDPAPSACREGGLLEAPQPGVALHYSATWTLDTGAAAYEANVMIGPGVDEPARAALSRAYDSMSFPESRSWVGTSSWFVSGPFGPPAYVVDSGVQRGREWNLEAFSSGSTGSGLGLVFVSEEHRSGVVSNLPPEQALAVARTQDATMAWGAARLDVARILAEGDNGRTSEAEIVPLPPSFDVPYSAFVVSLPDPSGTTVRALGAAGQEMARESLGLTSGSGDHT